MGWLDAHDAHVEKKCAQLTKQSSIAEKFLKKSGITGVIDSVKEFIKDDIVTSIANSPLRDLAEDILTETVNKNARRLSQNILNQVPEKVTDTLTDLRGQAFNAILTGMTLQNDLALYFASVVAKEAVEAIREKRQILVGLLVAIKNVHNAMLTLASGPAFFNDYLKDLRAALVKFDEADKQLAIVESAFFSTSQFPQTNFQNAKDRIQEARDLILPPIVGDEAEELKKGFLKGVFTGAEYGQQLAQLMAIPKLAWAVIQKYDLYAVKVVKVNALLLGFQSVIQELKLVTGGKFKDLILTHMADSRIFLQDTILDMARTLNGSPTAIEGPEIVDIRNQEGRLRTTGDQVIFSPNPTKASAKAVLWGVRASALQAMLEFIDPDALQKLTLSNTALIEYNLAVTKLSKLDDRVTSVAILRATDAREEPGAIEADIVVFVAQANQAVLDSSLTATSATGAFKPNTVLALGAKLDARLNLSIDQDRESEEILLRFIKKTEGLLDGIRQLGDSIFGLMDNLGMDRAADALRGGKVGKFFDMNGRTATYAGAAVAGLSIVQAAVTSEEQRECVVSAITRIKAEDTSQKIAAQRAASQTFVKQQALNELECKALIEEQKKVNACAGGIDVNDLRDNPLDTISGAFNGVFGGDVQDSLFSSDGFFGEISFGSGNFGTVGGVLKEKIVGVKTSLEAGQRYAESQLSAAENLREKAEADMKGALDSAGVEVGADESFESIKGKLTKLEVSDGISQDIKDQISEAQASVDISFDADKQANLSLKGLDSQNDLFGQSTEKLKEVLSGQIGNTQRFYQGAPAGLDPKTISSGGITGLGGFGG